MLRVTEKHPEKEKWIFLAGILIGFPRLLYISLKSYPVIENADPEKMKWDGYGDIGRWIAFCLGRMIEQKWIRFEPRCTKRNLAAGLVGAAILYFMMEPLWYPVTILLGIHWGTFTVNAIIMLFIMAIWPAVIKGTERQGEHTCKDEPTDPACLPYT